MWTTEFDHENTHSLKHTGTFSSVYKAIDLEHDLYDNSDWDYDMDAPSDSGSAGEMSLAPTKPANSEGGKVVAIKRIYVTSSPVRIQNEIAILHDLRYASRKQLLSLYHGVFVIAVSHTLNFALDIIAGIKMLCH